MSLSLLQGYSSAEEEDDQQPQHPYLQNSDEDEEDDDEDEDEQNDKEGAIHDKSFIKLPIPSSGSGSSGLPSVLDLFSEISGPPAFLNNSVEEYGKVKDVGQQQQPVLGRRRNHRKENKQHLPAGVVVEAKPQLVGIHERVRSDIEGNRPPASSVTSKTEGGKRVATVTNPNAEDAAELLRMCLQCGIPKTFSNARGMVCPVCGDRPLQDASNELKKKGSTIKDKEKSKRMKGQSSHASWKSETEMQLRQQFD
ncbi:hypothetical protein RGQ29_006237 [Quercus rubra]|uniref:Uncharacterized protein n=1 Tax=Quercus rubra TaxID=3512 RepID=A0AAN7I4Y3_QUERU|nr:hypothetical protein RGQ29_006237 [Quercus rubra]